MALALLIVGVLIVAGIISSPPVISPSPFAPFTPSTSPPEPCSVVDREIPSKALAEADDSSTKVIENLDLVGMVAVPPPAGFRLEVNVLLDFRAAVAGHAAFAREWATFLEQHRFRRGMKRVHFRGEDNVLVEVLELGSPFDAIALQRRTNLLTCGVSTDAYSVEDLPHAVGLQYRFSDGRMVEQVSFASDNRRFLVLAGSYREFPNRDLVIPLARRLAEQAVSSVATVCDRAAAHLKSVTDLPTSGPGRLPEVLPRRGPGSFDLVRDASVNVRELRRSRYFLEGGLPAPAFRGAHQRVWQGINHTLRATVVRLDTAQRAREAQRVLQAELCGAAGGWFPVEGVEGSLLLEFGFPRRVKVVATLVRGPHLLMAELFSFQTPAVDIVNEFVGSMDRAITRRTG